MAIGDRCRNSKFSTHHQDQSMEKLATRERGVHLHTLEDRDAGALQERGWRICTRSDSDRGRFLSERRTTAPPRSTHVQPGDVSHALIQQGERERLGKTPSNSSTRAWWWWRNAGIPQGFAKHRGGGEGLGRGGGLRQNLLCGCLPTPHIYIGARDRGAGPSDPI